MNRPLRLAECSHPISWVFATLSQTGRSRRADLLRPHIGIHSQNDERKHVCGEMDMCICLCQNTGAMNRSPTPGGEFRGYFVGECWVFAECFVVISWVFVALLIICSQRNGRLLATVGADLSCPCIRARHTFVKRWGTFAIRLKHIYVMFATYSLSVCYIFAV